MSSILPAQSPSSRASPAKIAAGVVALDARIRVLGFTDAGKSSGYSAHPRELEEMLESADGRTLLIRPIVAEDEPAFLQLFSMMTAEDIRMRFFAPSKVVSHPVAARLTQIDCDREMGFILTEPGPPGNSEVYAAIHLAAAPREEAEFAITVRSDLSGRGYGRLLMAKTSVNVGSG